MNQSNLVITLACLLGYLASYVYRARKEPFYRPAILGLLVTGAGLFISGCSSAPVRRAVVDTATTSAGAALGANLAPEGKEARGAAIGGAAGLILGELYNYSQDKELQKAYLTGYEKGRSDAVKNLYWAKQALNSPTTDNQPSVTLREVPVPQHKASDGTIIRASTEVIEVVSP